MTAPSVEGAEFAKSSLRIFLSIDIVGSTAFKQQREVRSSFVVDHEVDQEASWQNIFLGFYRDTKTHIHIVWAEIAAAAGENAQPVGDPPAFWKTAGDEVLFSKAVTSKHDALAAVQCLVGALEKIRSGFRTKHKDGVSLDVKGAAWLAGFPINNMEIAITASPGATFKTDDTVVENALAIHSHRTGQAPLPVDGIDYIGPSIDLGFRIRQFATPRRLIVSADLAYILSRCRGLPAEQTSSRHLCDPTMGFDGKEEIRGLLAGMPYPIFWVEADHGNDLNEAEDKLIARRSVQLGDVEVYASKFLDGSNVLRMKPYIPNSSDAEFGKIPPARLERLKKLNEQIRGQRERYLNMQDAASGAGDGDIPTALSDNISELAKTANESPTKS